MIHIRPSTSEIVGLCMSESAETETGTSICLVEPRLGGIVELRVEETDSSLVGGWCLAIGLDLVQNPPHEGIDLSCSVACRGRTCCWRRNVRIRSIRHGDDTALDGAPCRRKGGGPASLLFRKDRDGVGSEAGWHPTRASLQRERSERRIEHECV